MKSSDTLVKQLTPVWLGSYVRYDQVKTLLKLILKSSEADAKTTHISKLWETIQSDIRNVSTLISHVWQDVQKSKLELVRSHTFLDENDGVQTSYALDKLDQSELRTVLEEVAVQHQLLSTIRYFQALNLALLRRIKIKVEYASSLLNDSRLVPVLACLKNADAASWSPLDGSISTSAWYGKVRHTLQPRSMSLNEAAFERQASDDTAEGKLELGDSNRVAVISPSDLDYLILAAKNGNDSAVKSRLTERVNVNTTESLTGRTALWYACNNGHAAIVQYLLDVGADQEMSDVLGWTPQDRAAYRGHSNIVEILKDTTMQPAKIQTGNHGVSANGNGSNTQKRIHMLHSAPRAMSDPRKLVAASKDEGVVVINFGNLRDTTKKSAILFSKPLQEVDSHQALRIYVRGSTSPKCIISLPIVEDTVNKPCVFRSSNLHHTQLCFDLIHNFEGVEKLIGSGTICADELSGSAGSMLENVARAYRVNLWSDLQQVFVGSLFFSALVVKSFATRTSIPKPRPWSFGDGIGGHRGSGQNKAAWKFLQIGENTLKAFEEGKRQGASYVEFDVQMTKDLVPIIYHDFFVSETGLDAPVHSLTFAQFSLISEIQDVELSTPGNFRTRSRSVGTPEKPGIDLFFSQMSRTKAYRLRGFQPNTRGSFIHEPFTTLEKCCRELDASIGFDVEIKYPIYFETEFWKTDPNFIEINLFLDTILETLYKYASKRSIMFSSFCPEICIALSLKQDIYPVYFLTSGRPTIADSRAGSLQEAVHFAKRWSLAGIVTESSPLVNCPHLVDYVKSFDLSVATYGPLNNEPEDVRTQIEAGVDGVIVDRVKYIQENRHRQE